ncbi:hypothetical protein [Allohahella marinimesophila]|uniref:Uncharacterized protein n=1 Tax=Allohahella marinimesophila TaxID=1054972 RepID=A0ABP7NRA9_9GAMM
MRNRNDSLNIRDQLSKAVHQPGTRAQQIDRALTVVLKAALWIGYGSALACWFVAVNAIILFSQMLNAK